MADQDSNPGRRVLHVAPTSHEAAERIAKALAHTGCHVDECPDVYRALVRICRPGAHPPDAVVVCVDWLEAGQFEFFQLATGRRPAVPIYVYAETCNHTKIELAVRLGANGEIGADTAGQVLPGQSGTQSVSGPAARAASPTADPPPSPAEPRSRPAAVEQKPIGTGTVRVPWLRYEGGPTRVPPAKPDAGPPQPDRSPDLETDPRLLSPEELDALIGDPKPDAESDVSGTRKPNRGRSE